MEWLLGLSVVLICIFLYLCVLYKTKFNLIKDKFKESEEKNLKLNTEIDSLRKENNSFMKESGKYEQQSKTIEEKDSKIKALETKVDDVQTQMSLLQQQISSLEKDREHIKQEKAKLEEIREGLITASKLEFKNIANEILKTTTQDFKSIGKDEINKTILPFAVDLKSFKEKVEKQTEAFNLTKGSLENELKNVISQGNQLKEQTANLIDIFKTDSKTKGDFGENILQTILENSNLQKDVNYFVQQQEDNKRTDFQIKLPNNKWIVIDSKVPLKAYIEYCQAQTEEQKKNCLDKHIESIKGFISSLSGKKYFKKFDKEEATISPDFTLMFIYPEEAYIAALRYRETLTNEAWEKNVAIVSATSLIHTIKIIEKLWDVHRQVENHEKIVALAQRFKDKLAIFVDYIGKVGGSIKNLSDNYNKLQSNIKGHGGLDKIVDDLSSYGIDSSNNKLNLDNIKEVEVIENKLLKNQNVDD